MLPAISVNKGSSHQPRGADCTGAHWREFRMEKNRILALDVSGAHQRNNFNKPRLLHLPIHWKVLNSLTWDVWFSLISSNWCSDYLGCFYVLFCFCKNSYISWLLPYLFRTVPQLSERLYPRLKSPRLCIFFQSTRDSTEMKMVL